MRLGRSVTAIGAAAALAAAGLAVSTPAFADTTDDGFTLDAPDSRIVDPNSSLTVTGSGCGTADNPGQVAVALANNQDETASTWTYVDAGADGTWTATVDVASAVADLNGDPDVDPWFVVAACNAYGQGTSDIASEQIFLDGTRFDGSYIISGQAGAQTFEIKASGLTPGETATAVLIREADSDSADATPVATIGSGTVDESGNFNDTFPAPSVPDGTYVLRLTGDRYGEGGDSVSLVTVTNGVYNTAARATDDPNNTGIAGDDTATTPTAESSTAATVSATVPASASGKELAKTGSEGLTLTILAAGLVASGALLRARRRA
ncbi:LPXTG cell wall anchor domain-containing protein [Actinomyces sp. MRS3W]|uniref:LPXTG cell wall anchor domain-containing protein n=1 Tax=Actinomyces sp. MRS3W TaxID=2800796 RepID=UPI0028FDA39E|nr:LPXTG cell wall anchor domain-containing protein [Actinomyces sp. MRS3W]MDU0347645.1 LPXTG cell wall anchor domain-containing protein [Actinomyces sp. MRS3W]